MGQQNTKFSTVFVANSATNDFVCVDDHIIDFSLQLFHYVVSRVSRELRRQRPLFNRIITCNGKSGNAPTA